MKNSTNLRKFILLWAGELISSIGGGLTSFGLGVGRGAAIAVQVAGGFMAVIAAGMMFVRSIRELESKKEPAAIESAQI